MFSLPPAVSGALAAVVQIVYLNGKVCMFVTVLLIVCYLPTAPVGLFWESANGQYFEEPTKYFEKFEFDMVNRGSFNISSCLKDLMTCLELVKPDVICAGDSYFDTVCPTTRAVCHDYYKDYDSYNHRFITSESFCPTDREQYWT